MRRASLLVGAAFVLGSSIALAAPESLLPPGFDSPAPAPAPVRSAAPAALPTASAVPNVQSASGGAPIPGAVGVPAESIDWPEGFPSIAELEKMSADEVDDLFGLKPTFDIPAGARRALSGIGILARDEGGFLPQSLSKQPASLVRAALKGTKHAMVSRWGHILLRRALASRLDTPEGMNAVEFAALRAAVLNRIGESYAARALVQDVDSANYDEALTDAAFDAYVATGDIVGMCPVARLKGDLRKDPQWEMMRSICLSFDGNSRLASRDLNRALSREIAPRIDVLLAQRYAGAAGDGQRAVNIEWDAVTALTPWRYSLAVALGVDVPDKLRSDAGAYYDRVGAVFPALPLQKRALAADRAAGEGILSGAGMVDLYAMIYADSEIQGDSAQRANLLREAYVAETAAARVDAIRNVWAAQTPDYGRLVLTSAAAARITPSADFEDDAGALIASMLTAGYDRNAMRWAQIVPQGSLGWGLLALAQQRRNGTIDTGALDTFVDDDESVEQRKSKFLFAGLAGLGRLDADAVGEYSESLGVPLNRESAWSRKITQAAEYRNAALVSLLAGLGMQGDSWDKMTARQLYLIVRSLDQVGLSAEARMIAAEAVARG